MAHRALDIPASRGVTGRKPDSPTDRLKRPTVQWPAPERTSAAWFLRNARSLRRSLPERRRCLLFSIVAFQDLSLII